MNMNQAILFPLKKNPIRQNNTIPTPSMSFRSCGHLQKMSPGQEKPMRRPGQSRDVLPKGQTPTAPARHEAGVSLTLNRRAGTGVKQFM